MKCQHDQKQVQSGPMNARCLGDVVFMASATGPSGLYVVPLCFSWASSSWIGIGFRPDWATEPCLGLSCGWTGGIPQGRFGLGEVLAKRLPRHSRS